MSDKAPRCPRCDGRMEFQRVDPGIRGFENRVYECGRCYTMKTESVSLGNLTPSRPKGQQVRPGARNVTAPAKSEASSTPKMDIVR